MRDSLPSSIGPVPDGLRDQGKAAKLMRLPIGDLVKWQLLCSCAGCRVERLMHVGELVDRCGPEQTLVMLVPRLRCERCRRPPAKVLLRNRSPTQAAGSPFVEAVLKGEYRPALGG